ncbi:hypothetical protein LTR12_010566 [Friedmanniomyces endolithicus]|uniref:Uncharacterized protein n=1 Tax=Friedmanniomyces endolithicus TaxID=329885 RepID=A0A4U0VAX4_9PEZI|nr:hypothetical protein LTS09_016214 [Friedmanniomyces endolithicus]KAK1815048.1 hypothetical protein LTR12_010566 [Friedmanniomyces endolithicus]TKA45206.1 hypothetical protein B0A54_04302 [Friedmanniomyces endolithicus]
MAIQSTLALLGLPQELRDRIYDYAINAEHDHNTAPPADRGHRQAQAGPWTLKFDTQPPQATYLSLLRCNRQLYQEVKKYLAHNDPQTDVTAELDLHAKFPDMTAEWKCVPRCPSQAAQDLHISLNMRNLLDREFKAQDAHTLLLKPLFEILKCYVFKGPYFARSQPLHRSLELGTVHHGDYCDTGRWRLQSGVGCLAGSGLLEGAVGALEIHSDGQPNPYRYEVQSHKYQEVNRTSLARAGIRWDLFRGHMNA